MKMKNLIWSGIKKSVNEDMSLLIKIFLKTTMCTFQIYTQHRGGGGGGGVCKKKKRTAIKL